MITTFISCKYKGMKLVKNTKEIKEITIIEPEITTKNIREDECNPMLWIEFYTGLAWNFNLKNTEQGNEWIDKIMESVQNGENIFVDLEQG